MQPAGVIDRGYEVAIQYIQNQLVDSFDSVNIEEANAWSWLLSGFQQMESTEIDAVLNSDV